MPSKKERVKRLCVALVKAGAETRANGMPTKDETMEFFGFKNTEQEGEPSANAEDVGGEPKAERIAGQRSQQTAAKTEPTYPADLSPSDSSGLIEGSDTSKAAAANPYELPPAPGAKQNLASAFLGGIDPRGTHTMHLGRTTDPAAYKSMQLAGTLGGAVGGAAILPGLLTGGAGAISALVGRRPGSLLRHFWQGATRPYKAIAGGMASRGTLNRAAREGRRLSPDEARRVGTTLGENVSLAQAAKTGRGMGQVGQEGAESLAREAAHLQSAATRAVRQGGQVAEQEMLQFAQKVSTQAGMQMDPARLSALAQQLTRDAAQGKLGATVSQMAQQGRSAAGNEAARIMQAGLQTPAAARLGRKVGDATGAAADTGLSKAERKLYGDLSGELRTGVIGGGLALGGAGAVSGLSAYKQYGVGQQLQQAQRAAEERTRGAYAAGQAASGMKAAALVRSMIKQAEPPAPPGGPTGSAPAPPGMPQPPGMPETGPPAPGGPTPGPLSAKTAIADFTVNERYKDIPHRVPEIGERQTIEKLMGGMSRSRARVVGAHRQGRKSVANAARVRELMQQSGLWG